MERVDDKISFHIACGKVSTDQNAILKNKQ